MEAVFPLPTRAPQVLGAEVAFLENLRRQEANMPARISLGSKMIIIGQYRL